MIEAVTNEVSSGGKVTIIGFWHLHAATRGGGTGAPEDGKEIKSLRAWFQVQGGAAFRALLRKRPQGEEEVT